MIISSLNGFITIFRAYHTEISSGKHVAELTLCINNKNNINTAVIDMIYVEVDFRNQGIGSKLIKIAESYSIYHKCCEICLRAKTTGNPENSLQQKELENWYSKLGYKGKKIKRKKLIKTIKNEEVDVKWVPEELTE